MGTSLVGRHLKRRGRYFVVVKLFHCVCVLLVIFVWEVSICEYRHLRCEEWVTFLISS